MRLPEIPESMLHYRAATMVMTPTIMAVKGRRDRGWLIIAVVL